MTTRISKKEVEHVARLARLALGPDDVERMQGELEGILSFMATLEKLNTDGVPPTTHSIAMHVPLREDVPQPSLQRNEVLAAAAKSEAGAFAVPKVLDGE
ncbi:MAG: Asp-tRNA(Asn)/Glu-tRNA(Gln) amidotransferase subunit GatC [Sandaracinus sp.]